MRNVLFLLIGGCFLALASCGNSDDVRLVAEEDIDPNQGASEVIDYTKMDYLGFVIQVQTSALADHAAETNLALDKVKADLDAIVNDYELAGDVLDSLRQIPFFIDWMTSISSPARFHASRNWLVNNGYILEKLNSIEISNVQSFLYFTELNSPNLLLHEIAHLYHLTTLTVHYEPIYEAFVNARETGLYNSVDYYSGNDIYVENREALATTDQLNYFAELTEAYFGVNDYFPHHREQLREHDPQGFAVIEEVWKD